MRWRLKASCRPEALPDIPVSPRPATNTTRRLVFSFDRRGYCHEAAFQHRPSGRQRHRPAPWFQPGGGHQHGAVQPPSQGLRQFAVLRTLAAGAQPARLACNGKFPVATSRQPAAKQPRWKSIFQHPATCFGKPVFTAFRSSNLQVALSTFPASTAWLT